MASSISPEVWLTEQLQSPPKDDLKKLKVDTYWLRLMKSAVPVPELDVMLGISNSNSFLFCGPSGCGKRSLAVAMAGTLCQLGYQYVHVSGRDLDEDLRHRVQAIFRQIDQDKPMILICEDLESSANMWELGVCLGQMAQVCREQKLPLTMIVIAKSDEDLPDALLRNLYMCRFTLPDLQERTAFYEAALGSKFPLRQGLTPRDLAVASEGLQLRQLVQTLRFMMLSLKELALTEYRSHFAMAAEAIRGKELVVDMPMFRSIVAHIKAPEKAAPSQSVVQVVQAVGSPVGAASMTADAGKKQPESQTEKLRGSKNASDFFANL